MNPFQGELKSYAVYPFAITEEQFRYLPPRYWRRLAPCGHPLAATYGTKCQLPICAGDRESHHKGHP